MKKFFFAITLSLFAAFTADAAVTPVGSGTIPCAYTASVRHYTYNPTTGVTTYYGPYYYFNSLTDAFTYILEQYPPVPYERNSGANIACYTEGPVIGPPGP
ncbi:hypothetical protein [Edaphocola flava]|jgi:hypothetical protein|uniref:hypothetical protein n=1 Tax=Edaphocola flava TaxID=2499629 RepID=UPI00100ABB71|nr:hypothetical protein [Edaphocola flava]